MRSSCGRVILSAVFLFCAGSVRAQSTRADSSSATTDSWIQRSDEYAKILLALDAKYSPEEMGHEGVPGLDEQITQFPPDRRERLRQDTQAAITQLQQFLVDEKDPLVRQDLQIMARHAEHRLHAQDIRERYHLPYFNVAQTIFSGLHALLDEQLPQERRRAALVRLRKYAGIEPGYEPLTEQAKARTVEWSKADQLGPAKVEIESDLARADSVIAGIRDLFEKYKIQGYEEPYAKLRQQLSDYNGWLKQQILPKARADFRLPPEEYTSNLQRQGVEIAPDQLAGMAHRSFAEYQQEMQEIAAKLAKQHRWKSRDYRDAIRQLKKNQILGDAIIPEYEKTLQQIEQIIRRKKLVSLPSRPASIRLATAAETVQTPAPHMEAPQLLHNTGEHGVFVLPLNVPSGAGSGQTRRMDDFTYTAATWTMTAHEARPGHELQFDYMVEHGVSIARSIYGFNSANVEGWGLYAEYIMKPYMPLDGQLISLQLRLMRAARAFIDPELQSGKLKPEDAMRILTEDVVLSDAFANSEVERYTFWAPGQATSYYYGYTRLLEIRKEAESRMGKKFEQFRFHNFVLAQGLLPPDLLRRAVLEQFLPVP